MGFSRTRTIAVAALLGAALTVPMGSATAGMPLVTVSPDTQEREVPTFSFEVAPIACEEFDYLLFDGATEITDGYTVIEDETPNDGTAVSGSLLLTELAPVAFSGYELEVRCLDGQEPQQLGRGSAFFARLTVTKTVVNSAEEGTTFDVQVGCEVPEGESVEPGNIDEMLTFDAEGGSLPVIVYDPALECLVSEPSPPEDAQVETNPEDGVVQFGVETDLDLAAEVTNTFPAAPEPEPEPTTEPTEDTDDTVEEAEPAEPVEAEPSYTG